MYLDYTTREEKFNEEKGLYWGYNKPSLENDRSKKREKDLQTRMKRFPDSPFIGKSFPFILLTTNKC